MFWNSFGWRISGQTFLFIYRKAFSAWTKKNCPYQNKADLGNPTVFENMFPYARDKIAYKLREEQKRSKTVENYNPDNMLADIPAIAQLVDNRALSFKLLKVVKSSNNKISTIVLVLGGMENKKR